MIWFLEKKSNLWSYFDIEYNSAESLTNKSKVNQNEQLIL